MSKSDRIADRSVSRGFCRRPMWPVWPKMLYVDKTFRV